MVDGKNGLQFSLEMASGKKEAAEKSDDPRGLAQRLFTKFDNKTGEVSTMPISIINCATGTPADQGIKSWDLTNQIPLFLAYKDKVADFKGPTKGRDFVIIGKRPGRGGSAGIMVDIREIQEFIDGCQALCDALTPEVVDAYRKQCELPARVAPEAGVPVTQATNVPPTVEGETED